MRNLRNRQLVLKERPQGVPQPRHFDLVEHPVPEPGHGQVLVRNIYVSADPAQRGWVNAAANYSQPVPIGGVMRAFAVGEVIASGDAEYRSGEIVSGLFGWQEFCNADPSAIWWKVDPAAAPISTALGVLGLNGITAYFGLLEVGQPAKGETVVVSTAAGSVGSAVGQIAKIKGCRAVGLTGSNAKVALCLEEFGYDAAVNYRRADLDEALQAACPDGIDVYFDNTGGAISDAVLRHINVGARIAICGTVANASWDPPPQGPRVERALLVKRARMQGFVAFDFQDRYTRARRKLAQWVGDRQLRYREEIVDGLENAPAALAGLYEGRNLGKTLIRVGAEPEGARRP